MPLDVWAPRATTITLEVLGADGVAGPPTRREPLRPDPNRPGWWRAETHPPHAGEDYWLEVDGVRLPDPRARWLPAGVHGPARHWDPAEFRWTDGDWSGRELAQGAVLYEVHVGTFTPTGTLDGAAARLPYLQDLGITHVELMPLAAFDGTHGWGYDGVAINAVHEPYGGPDALCRFVDAAHALGLAVVLDIVQNHLGPSGDYWDRFGPFRTEQHHTPWGPAVNLDGPGSDDVRSILLGSACSWIREFHLDGLRLDAVHELRDDRAIPFLEEISVAVDELAGCVGRPLALIAESDRNDPRLITPREAGGLGIHAQWSDDVHHALHWLATGETQGYYQDFGSAEAAATALARGFLHAGGWSSFRGRSHGRPVDWSVVEPWQLVVCLQNHDQVGNRARGERLTMLAPERAAPAAAVLLSLPYTPMLFMGEEWGAETPWAFFSSMPDPLGASISAGRRKEFSCHGWIGDVPDPQAPSTFRRSVLDWSEPSLSQPSRLHGFYRDLLSVRAALAHGGSGRRGPHPSTADGMHVRVTAHGDGHLVRVDRTDLTTLAWFGTEHVTVPAPGKHVLARSGVEWSPGAGGMAHFAGPGAVVLAPRSPR